MGVVNGLATSFSPAETKEFKNLVEDATVVDVTIDGKPQKAVIFKKDLIGKKFPYEQMVHTKVGGIQGMICSCSFPVIDRE